MYEPDALWKTPILDTDFSKTLVISYVITTFKANCKAV